MTIEYLYLYEKKFETFRTDSIKEFYSIAKDLAVNCGVTPCYAVGHSGIFLTSYLNNGWGEQFQLCYWFNGNSREHQQATVKLSKMISKHATRN